MKVNSNQLVKDANFSKKVLTFAILFPLYCIVFLLIVFYFNSENNPYAVSIMFVFLAALIMLWWKFPRKCSKDGLPMKYQKRERHFGYFYMYYQCPKGHILEKKHIQSA